jgi:hypothetical protein
VAVVTVEVVVAEAATAVVAEAVVVAEAATAVVAEAVVVVTVEIPETTEEQKEKTLMAMVKTATVDVVDGNITKI